MYYDDILFRQRVLNKIFNSYKQLQLDLSECDKITYVSVLGNVHLVKNLWFFLPIHTLHLIGCKNIKDISALGNVHLIKN